VFFPAVCCSGYYKNSEATKNLRDEDGFLLTGDIVEERGPNLVTYIDRKVRHTLAWRELMPLVSYAETKVLL